MKPWKKIKKWSQRKMKKRPIILMKNQYPERMIY